MNLYTPVTLPPHTVTLDTDSKVMMLGSCFAEHVGERLRMYMGCDSVDVNPFGVLYNPASIAQAIKLLISQEDQPSITGNEHIFHGQDGVWHSWLHSSHFSDKTKEGCIEKTTARLADSREMLKDATLLCITFGTTRHYRHNGLVVANCHKEPQRCFAEEEPSLEELKILWANVLQELKAFNPNLKTVFTVSPYRYRKYGFHVSQIQKAKLLLLCDYLCNSRKTAENEETYTAYFPSYEIQLDELRDYRFYKEDMLHPSDQAVNIIAERFMDWSFSSSLKEESMKRLKEYRLKQHRKLI